MTRINELIIPKNDLDSKLLLITPTLILRYLQFKLTKLGVFVSCVKSSLMAAALLFYHVVKWLREAIFNISTADKHHLPPLECRQQGGNCFHACMCTFRKWLPIWALHCSVAPYVLTSHTTTRALRWIVVNCIFIYDTLKKLQTNPSHGWRRGLTFE